MFERFKQKMKSAFHISHYNKDWFNKFGYNEDGSRSVKESGKIKSAFVKPEQPAVLPSTFPSYDSFPVEMSFPPGVIHPLEYAYRDLPCVGKVNPISDNCYSSIMKNVATILSDGRPGTAYRFLENAMEQVGKPLTEKARDNVAQIVKREGFGAGIRYLMILADNIEVAAPKILETPPYIR